MKNIDKSIIKRNYFYIIFNILKDKTSKSKHLSIKEICDIIFEKYELKIDKNTVSRVFEDLVAFGNDIKKDEKGYYLDARVFTDGEMGLLIDGIESINVLPPDSKTQIYEKICKINGKKIESVDYYLYNQDDNFINEEVLAIIETIYTAIGDNKKLNVFYPIAFMATLIDELTNEEEEYLSNFTYENLSYDINPYQLFRSSENNLFLLYYYKLPTRCVIGTIDLSSIEKISFEITDYDRDKIDISLLLSKDLTDFTSPNDYRNGERLVNADIVPAHYGDEKTLYFKFILDKCESYEIVKENEFLKYRISYKEKNSYEIIDCCIIASGYVKVLKGSILFIELNNMLHDLKAILNKKN